MGAEMVPGKGREGPTWTGLRGVGRRAGSSRSCRSQAGERGSALNGAQGVPLEGADAATHPRPAPGRRQRVPRTRGRRGARAACQVPSQPSLDGHPPPGPHPQSCISPNCARGDNSSSTTPLTFQSHTVQTSPSTRQGPPPPSQPRGSVPGDPNSGGRPQLGPWLWAVGGLTVEPVSAPTRAV